jgi:hypothetical protein
LRSLDPRTRRAVVTFVGCDLLVLVLLVDFRDPADLAFRLFTSVVDLLLVLALVSGRRWAFIVLQLWFVVPSLVLLVTMIRPSGIEGLVLLVMLVQLVLVYSELRTAPRRLVTAAGDTARSPVADR